MRGNTLPAVAYDLAGCFHHLREAFAEPLKEP